MFAFITLRGLFMALGTATMNLVMTVLLASLIVRRAIDLVLIAKATRPIPEILRKLGSDISNEPLQVGDQASRMVMAQGVAETNQDVQDEEVNR
ncbi:hypothetical protein FVEN_g13130 [Fusarium venenatum]|nr:hypothetical protein FVEN_g13130 [Fusarium venenatum]